MPAYREPVLQLRSIASAHSAYALSHRRAGPGRLRIILGRVTRPERLERRLRCTQLARVEYFNPVRRANWGSDSPLRANAARMSRRCPFDTRSRPLVSATIGTCGSTAAGDTDGPYQLIQLHNLFDAEAQRPQSSATERHVSISLPTLKILRVSLRPPHLLRLFDVSLSRSQFLRQPPAQQRLGHGRG